MQGNFWGIPIVIFLFFGKIFPQSELPFPGEPTSWHTFSDANSGGKSENFGFKTSDSGIQWTFRLNDNDRHQWPFVGISRTLARSERRSFDQRDTLLAEISCNHQIRIVMRLGVYDPSVTKLPKFLTWRMLEYPVEIGKERRCLAVALELFKVAEWWKRLNGIGAEDNRLFLDSVRRIDLVVNDPQYFGNKDTLKIGNLTIKSGRESVVFGKLALWALLFFSTVSGALVLFCKHKRHGEAPEAINDERVFFQPRQLAANPTDWDRILDFIQNNYSDPELSIQKIARTLGYSDSKLSHVINGKFPLGFRYLVNDLRISEAKRLLTHSEMSVSEIAYKLGYSTPNHFNREFRKRTDTSPSAYRTSISNSINFPSSTPSDE